MTTPQDSTNTTERVPGSSGSLPDEPRRASGPERQSAMPPGRTWLWFALILLANFLLVGLLFPGPEAPIEVPHPLAMPFCLEDVLVVREIGGMGHAIARRQGSGKAVLLADFYKKTPNSATESMKSVASSGHRSCHAPLLGL